MKALLCLVLQHLPAAAWTGCRDTGRTSVAPLESWGWTCLVPWELADLQLRAPEGLACASPQTSRIMERQARRMNGVAALGTAPLPCSSHPRAWEVANWQHRAPEGLACQAPQTSMERRACRKSVVAAKGTAPRPCSRHTKPVTPPRTSLCAPPLQAILALRRVQRSLNFRQAGTLWTIRQR